jgi:hypothetical protein
VSKVTLLDVFYYYRNLLDGQISFDNFREIFTPKEDILKFTKDIENIQKFATIGVFIEESDDLKRYRSVMGTLNRLETFFKSNSEILSYYKDKYKPLTFPGFLLKLHSENFEINSKFSGRVLMGDSKYEKISEFLSKWDDGDTYYGLAFMDLRHSAGLLTESQKKKGFVKISATLKEIKVGMSTIIALPLANKKEQMKRNFTDGWGYDNILNGTKFMGVEFKDINILDLTGKDKVGLNSEHNWNFRFSEDSLFLIVLIDLR